MEETIKFLNNLLSSETIVVGLSGGPDSMCLLDILLKLNKNIKIICAHINHNIREESKDELKFIEEYTSKLDVILETVTFPKKSDSQNYNELELREMRYKYFKELIDKYNAKYLFTAHHGDDLIETILMRITRGSNLKGYSGFELITDKEDYKIIKPLIFTTKDEINKYLEVNNIPYVIDNTNNLDDYTRNRYRHNILPFLKEENKNVHLRYLKFSKELLNYYNYVDKILTDEVSKRYKDKILYLDKFDKLDEFMKQKIIEYILDDNYMDNLYLVSDIHVNNILNIINSNKPNIIINLPDNLKVIKEYNKVIFTKEDINNKSYKIELESNTLLPNNKRIKIVEYSSNTSNYCTRLDSKELKLPLYLRTKNNGDRMIIKNMNHSKKVKDIYIDSKLSKIDRDTQPILVDSDNNILWIPGIKKSKFDKEISEKYDIILEYID